MQNFGFFRGGFSFLGHFFSNFFVNFFMKNFSQHFFFYEKLRFLRGWMLFLVPFLALFVFFLFNPGRERKLAMLKSCWGSRRALAGVGTSLFCSLVSAVLWKPVGRSARLAMRKPCRGNRRAPDSVSTRLFHSLLPTSYSHAIW